MARPSCRFCATGDGPLRRVRLDDDLSTAGARARRMARIPVYEHAACLDAAEAAHNAAQARIAELYAEAKAALAAGDLPRSIALIDAAADVTDSQFARPTSREA